MNSKKCKVCSDRHSSHGFCKYHAWAFKKGRIDKDGTPIGDLFYDNNKRLKKKKSNLVKTIKESAWYRNWRNEVFKRAGRSCSICHRKNIKLVAHHEKKKFAKILNEAKRKYADTGGQIEHCRLQHSPDIGICLCLKCHAEKHKDEKMYSSLLGKTANSKCKVCGQDEYCKEFCSKHYKSCELPRPSGAKGPLRGRGFLFHRKTLASA